MWYSISMKWLIHIGLLLVLLTGCGSAPSHPEALNYDCHTPSGDLKDYYVGESLEGIQKSAKPIQCLAESTPVVWHNEVLIVGPKTILNFLTHEVVATYPQGGIFTSAMVDNGTLYAFATASPDIVMSSTTDLVTWTPWVSIFKIDIAYSHQVYNTSVIHTPDGFVMAYEIDGEPGQTGYSWQVAVGPTLTSMVRVSNLFSTSYSACPVVKYVNGYYQFLYLAELNGVMVTKAARTKDFITYETTDKLFLAPSPNEGRNNSDVDLVEMDGKVFINYIDGNQQGWGDQMTALYDGTLSEMFDKMWE
jgi:hypothetical protein